MGIRIRSRLPVVSHVIRHFFVLRAFPEFCWQLVSGHVARFSTTYLSLLCSPLLSPARSTMDSPSDSADSLLEKLDASVPTTLKEFDAFPKLPSTYKSRSEGRGYITAFIALVCFVLVINDLGEWIWGWSDYEFSVDHNMNNQLGVNVDLVVNMPCQCE